MDETKTNERFAQLARGGESWLHQVKLPDDEAYALTEELGMGVGLGRASKAFIRLSSFPTRFYDEMLSIMMTNLTLAPKPG